MNLLSWWQFVERRRYKMKLTELLTERIIEKYNEAN